MGFNSGFKVLISLEHQLLQPWHYNTPTPFQKYQTIWCVRRKNEAATQPVPFTS